VSRTPSTSTKQSYAHIPILLVLCRISLLVPKPCRLVSVYAAEGHSVLTSIRSAQLPTQASRVKSTDSDPDAVKLMVHFFYHLDYCADIILAAPVSSTSSSTPSRPTHFSTNGKKSLNSSKASLTAPASARPVSQSTDGNMVMHAKVFAAVVKYQVSALKILAASKFAQAVKANANHASFAEAIHISYTTTPEEVIELRDVIVRALTAHEELLEKEEVEAVVRIINGFAYELLKRDRSARTTSATAKGDSEPGACSGCGGLRSLDTMSDARDCGRWFWPCSCLTACMNCGRAIRGTSTQL